MHLLPSRIKTKYRPYKQFYNMLRLPKRNLSVGRRNVDDLGLEPKSPKINSYTLYILCKCSDDQSEHSI